jgi:hypothetical protein
VRVEEDEERRYGAQGNDGFIASPPVLRVEGTEMMPATVENIKPVVKWPSDYARSRQLRRWWLVLAILRSGGSVTLERLAAETGVSLRTSRRDLYALEAAGIPLYRGEDFGESEYGRPWRLVKGLPCPVCGRGLATGKEYRREARASATPHRRGGPETTEESMVPLRV